MERNQCKYRYEQELVRCKYLKEVDHQKISTILRLERQKHRKKTKKLSSLNQHLNAAVIEQESNLNLKYVQNEIFIADDGLVINEAKILVLVFKE
jgi:phosphoglycerate-specific signal transduction histidine kinase